MTTKATVLQAERLRLRPWQDGDLEALAAMNADLDVMRYFPRCLDRDESASMMVRNTAHMTRHGFAWWAIEIPKATAFAGGVALLMPRFHAHFMPRFEIGWRLKRLIGDMVARRKQRARLLRLRSIRSR